MIEGECLIRRLALTHIMCIVLVLVLKNFFIISILVDRSGIVDRMLRFIEMWQLERVFLLQSWLCKCLGYRGR